MKNVRAFLYRHGLLALVLLAPLVTGCMHWAAPIATPDPGFPTIVEPATLTAQPYVLQPGDVIGIRFYRNPELDEEVTIRPDGMISLRLLDEVRAAGLTPADLDKELTTRYTGELASPDVTVIVRTPAGSRVYVGGEVGKQGVLRMTGPLTAFQAIQQSGGFAKTAHRKSVVLIRRDATGKPQGRLLDLREVQTGAHPESDVPLVPYDVVFVPRSKIANVNVFVEQYIREIMPVQGIPLAF